MKSDKSKTENDGSADEALMRRAIQLSRESAAAGGGPFGAIIACGNQIIGEGTNSVTTTNDPTAHAEMLAIRAASSQLEKFDLRGCQLYTSCEPCPMCFGAVLWSRLDTVYYANTRHDAASIGFDDENFYRELNRLPDKRDLPMTELLRSEAQVVFQQWLQDEQRRMY